MEPEVGIFCLKNSKLMASFSMPIAFPEGTNIKKGTVEPHKSKHSPSKEVHS